MDFPPGYGLELAGASRDQQEVFREMAIALFMGIGLMYLILVMQFGSFTGAAGGDALAAAQPDRRGAGAAGSPRARST